MTGYGRASFEIGGNSYAVEVKSLNNRYLDVKVRLPERFSPLENDIRAAVKKRFARGSFTINISTESTAAPELRPNVEAARAYLEAARSLKEELGVPGEIDIRYIMGLREVFQSERPAPGADDGDWKGLESGLAPAFGALEEWRVKEGASLAADIESRLAEIEGHVRAIEELVPEVIAAYRGAIEEEMKRLLGDRVDESRLLQEAALFAQKTDIGEEIVRLTSHIEMFRNYLGSPEPVGKRCDFLCQEILREANTIASKASDIRMTRTMVEVKGLLEKVREQVQNVE